MADNATSPFGVKVSTGTYTAGSETPPGSYTEYGQLIDLQLPNYDVGDIKATRLNQSDRFHRYKQSFVNAGEIGLTIHFAKADFASVLTAIAAATELWLKAEIPEPDSVTNLNKFEAHGFWKGAPVEVPNSDSQDGVTVKLTFKVNGKPIWTSYAA